ncbi:MAG: AMP nucleosidase [Candidatus Paracaedibacteraceae bacterium]|nr:AMP nucleosidase [Candidatus Paracaedibacteraceae bacterium]
MTDSFSKHLTTEFPIHEARLFNDADAALLYIQKIYNDSLVTIKDAFSQAVDGHADTINITSGCYPYVGFRVENKDLCHDPSFSYGAVTEPGHYGGTLTHPDHFHAYYREQIQLILERHKVPVVVGRSLWPIPLPFAVEHSPSDLETGQLCQVKNVFVLPDLSRIDDNGPNCTAPSTYIRPISLFTGERVDFSLHRLKHYTGTDVQHFQKFILLTNYQRYIDAFIDFSRAELKKEGTEYTDFVGPGSLSFTKENPDEEHCSKNTHLPQMPAYHLKRADGQGITFINIGVGPSNAKTITDHLAVLRPHCWLMLGHCAGLRSTQNLGDYVLAHGYVREDHVLDQDLPLWIPVPALAEIQVALQTAILNVTHESSEEVKSHMRTGTVLTTDNRNWELQSREFYERFRQSRAIAVDMESATITANGFRFRVPYGTLLCVSDKPIHGEIKLQGIANTFYRQRVRQHLEIGLETVRLLREGGAEQLHSRKLRGFDEPPFR